MVVSVCQHEKRKKHGKDHKGQQRFKCSVCGKTFIDKDSRPLGHMRTNLRDAVLALGMILEGLSIRSVERLTGLHRDTIDELILTVGDNCQRLLDATIKGVETSDVQADEIWSFVGCKEKNRLASGRGEEFGDSWTFIAIDADTKLILAHKVGQRDAATCCEFLHQLRDNTVGRFQLTTDGLATYTSNVPFILRDRVDYAQLVKQYESKQSETRYSPATIISAEKKAVFGNPDPERISTSYIERANLTLRMTLRRFTRLTNAHSKSLKHHVAMQALFVAWYNFCRTHETVKATPAVAAGVADKAWSLKRLIEDAASC